MRPEQMGISEGTVYALHRDRQGTIWLGDGWNIFRSADGGRTFEEMKQFGYAFMRDILEDKEGNIWVATMGNGVFRYQPQTDETVNYLHIEGDSTSIGTNEVTGISEDSKGLLWFSTDRGGLSCFNPQTGTFRTYTKADGLPDNVTYKAVEDRQHRIWFGTDRGLVCLYPETDSLHVFTRNDGLPDNQFNYKSALAAGNGTIWMGTINGLVSFNPDQIHRNTFVPPVYITRIKVQGREIPLKPEGMRLPYRSNVSFDFAYITLHAGLGNFRDIDVEDLTKHKTDSEQMIVNEEAVRIVNHAKDLNRQVCAVGTTVMRAIESTVSTDGHLKEYEGWTNKFIFPPYDFTVANAMISNFHMPLSTLLMIVAAFGGYEQVMEAYNVALKEEYRFGTYGDAMLITDR